MTTQWRNCYVHAYREHVPTENNYLRCITCERLRPKAKEFFARQDLEIRADDVIVDMQGYPIFRYLGHDGLKPHWCPLED